MNQNILQSINAVEGFDPVEYAVDYTDLNSGETRSNNGLKRPAARTFEATVTVK